MLIIGFVMGSTRNSRWCPLKMLTLVAATKTRFPCELAVVISVSLFILAQGFRGISAHYGRQTWRQHECDICCSEHSEPGRTEKSP